MKYLLTILIMIPSLVSAQSAQEIIRMVDRNERYVTQKYSVTMIITKGKRELKKTFYGYGQKKGEKSLIVFTNPEDRGIRYLKLDQELWIYFPDADDIMKISGHMLRQGMMGSDISYEDMLESGDFEKKYACVLLPEQVIDGRPCFVVNCTAKVRDATYARQVLFVDRQRYVPVKIDMYAKGGRLLKRMTLSDMKNISGRIVPMTIKIRDMRKRGTGTVVRFRSISFDVPLDAGTFTRRSLRRK